MDTKTSIAEEVQPTNDWQMSVESFDDNGCMVNAD